MPLPDYTHTDFIASEVRTYYELHGKPIYLSELGKRFSDQFGPIQILLGINLSDLIEQKLTGIVKIIPHPTVLEKISVAPIEKAEEASKALLKANSFKDQIEEDLDINRV